MYRNHQARQLSLERLARLSRRLLMSGRNEEPGSVSGSRALVRGGHPAYRRGKAAPLLVDVAEVHPSRQHRSDNSSSNGSSSNNSSYNCESKM